MIRFTIHDWELDGDIASCDTVAFLVVVFGTEPHPPNLQMESAGGVKVNACGFQSGLATLGGNVTVSAMRPPVLRAV